jgi:hypothetical protein
MLRPALMPAAGNVLVVAAWGLFGLLIAIRRFRWEPAR